MHDFGTYKLHFNDIKTRFHLESMAKTMKRKIYGTLRKTVVKPYSEKHLMLLQYQNPDKSRVQI